MAFLAREVSLEQLWCGGVWGFWYRQKGEHTENIYKIIYGYLGDVEAQECRIAVVYM